MDKLALTIDGKPIPVPSGVPTGGLFTTGENIIRAFIGLAFIIAVLMALAYLILGGIKVITAGGDQKQWAAAKQQILFAVIGLIIVLTAFLIISIISGFFGIKLL